MTSTLSRHDNKRPRHAKPDPISPSPLTLTLALGCSALVSVSLSAPAAGADWTGAASSDWFVAGNWSPAALPAAGTDVLINSGTPNPAVISGPNATARHLSIGDATLTISNGGTLLTNGIGSIAYTGATSGAATVTGAGSTWTSVGPIYVGHITSGTGTLTISNGGKVYSGGGHVGFFSGSTGIASVDGAGSAWISNADIAIGEAGTGTLTISNGGLVSNVNGMMADTHAGSVTVTGANSTWANSGGLVVGNFRQATLTIANGGTVTSTTGIIGSFNGSVSSATVSGAGSTWTNSAGLTIGREGVGTLTIINGGAVSNTTGVIGAAAGSAGTAAVDGGGSTWTNSADLSVGKAGTGMLTITNGGTVTNVTGYVGQIAGATGTATVSGAGSAWTNSSELRIGQNGTGTLTISAGGTVSNTVGYLGNFSSGSATVDGTGSAWANSSVLYVGVSGSGVGTLTISGGGTVTNTVGHIGYSLNSTGTVTVDGAGSTWTSSSTLLVGTSGTGTLTIANGGTVGSASGIIGNTGTGSATVGGVNSTWTNSGSLTIGNIGFGTLTIGSGGTVSNTNGVLGNSAGSSGTVTVSGAAATWTSSADIVVGYAGTGTLNVGNGGVVSVGGPVQIAKLAGSVGTLNIGGAAGAAALAPGTLNGAPIQFGGGTGTVNFNHTSAGYTFASVVSGLGTINQVAGTTILTADSSGFTGATHVTGGRLAVNSSLANSVVTVSGGILGGTGTVGGILAQAGGTIGPGNSIGTLAVAGNVVQATGSIYQVELTSTGQADRINATGTATIASGAVLDVVKLDAAPYVLGTHYTVLQADGGVTGTYALSGNFMQTAFIGLVANYDSTHVYLDVAKVKSFAAAGQTPNQIATAGGVESLGSGHSLYDAVLLLPTDAAARAAFDSLSGEVHASARGVMIEDSRFVREAVTNRVRSAFDSVGAVATPVVTYGRGGAQAAPANTAGFAVWGQAFGSWGSVSGNGNAAALRRDIGGFFIGADGLVADRWRVGVVGGYSHGNMRVAARNSSLASDNYHVGLYAGTQWGDLALRTGLAYAWHDIGASRSVAFAGFADTLKSRYGARTAQAFGELGYRIRAGQLAFEPFANLAHVSLATDGFTETGGAAALSARDTTTGVTFTTLGLRASTDIVLGNGMSVTARGMLGWRHAFGATTPYQTLSFTGASPFSIAGAPIARNAAAVEAGLDLNLTSSATLGLSYGGQFGSGLTDQTLRGNFAVKF